MGQQQQRRHHKAQSRRHDDPPVRYDDSASHSKRNSYIKIIGVIMVTFIVVCVIFVRSYWQGNTSINNQHDSENTLTTSSSPNPNIAARTSAMDARIQALKLNGAGQVDKAIQLLEEGSQNYPDDPHIALDLAANYAYATRYEDALPAYHRALELFEIEGESGSKNNKKDSLAISKALTWIGVCHRRLGRPGEAIPWLERSREQYPENSENLYHLCFSYDADGRLVDAARALAAAMKLEMRDLYFELLSQVLSAMGFWDILNLAWGACLKEDGQCRLDKNPSPYHVQYAIALRKTGYQQEAIKQLEIAAKLSGNSLAAMEMTADQYYIQAQSNRHRAKDIPTDEDALYRMHQEFVDIFTPLFTDVNLTAWSIIRDRHVMSFRWPIPEDLVKRAKDTLEEQKRIFHQTGQVKDVVRAFTCLTLPIFTLEDCNFAAVVEARHLQKKLDDELHLQVMDYHSFRKEDFAGDDGPLRIGLFSSDIRSHPMMSLLHAFLNHSHPRKDVHVTLYHVSSDPFYLDRFRSLVDDEKECDGGLWAECVKHARRHRVQVWLETTGPTGQGIPAVAAAGPAPVGILWAGFPGSLGMTSTMQYIVLDRYTVPINSSIRMAYPEHMLYVPGSWMIADPTLLLDTAKATTISKSSREIVRTENNIPADAFVYCYFGRFWKVDDQLFDRWSQIISRVPNSYLVILMIHYNEKVDRTYMTEHIQEAWKKQNLPLDRLVILAPFMRGEHLAAMQHMCDVALDTALYGGGTTAYEAILAGLPLVHYSAPEGKKMMQRAGGSILTAAGLANDLIGKDLDEYVDIAVRLGNDTDYFQFMKQRVEDSAAGHTDAPLFRPEIGIARLVEGMKEAYHLWYMGQEPRDIFADRNYEHLLNDINNGLMPNSKSLGPTAHEDGEL
jgi:predicted O-linked N-acetylglucosamine transferase (SPINDLY family)/Flp pilus assembly protein TadD